MKRILKTGLIALTAAGVGLSALGAGMYGDIFGFDSDYQQGRTKNAIASVVTGIAAYEMNPSSNIDVEVEKSIWFDSRITGYTTPSTIETNMDLLLTSSRFEAHTRTEEGTLTGEVKKSEFNWGVRQTGPNRYEINRFGPKFDSRLELTVENGIISGTYVRPGPHFDWDVDGTYTADGRVEIEIDGPLNLGVTVKGEITPR